MVEVDESPRLSWKPMTKEQESFLSLPDGIFEAFFGGSVKCGKTELIMVMPLVLELYKHRRFKGLILRRTFQESEEFLQRSRDFYPQTGAIWRDKIKAYEWPEYNSRVRVGHVQHEKDIKDYDTDEYQFFAPDELTSYTEFMYKYIAASRVRRSSGNNLKPIVRAGGMPGGIGHGWVRKRFIEPYREGGKILVDKAGNKRIFIKAQPSRDLDPEYYDRLQILPEAEYRAKMGDWWTFSGQVFEDWRLQPLRDEPITAQHVVPPFSIPEWWPKIFAADIGIKTYFLWGVISPDERLYIYREKHFEKADVYEYATYAKEVSTKDGEFVDVVLDHTAFDSMRGKENSIATLFKKYSGMSPRPADKGSGSRVAGKTLLQDLLRWRGVEDSGPIPRMQVFSSCERIIDTMPLCVYDKKDGVETDDIAQFNDDEPIDTVRYLARSYTNYSKGGLAKFEKFRKTADIVRNLEITGDMTSFYRQMEHLEAKKSKSIRRRGFRRGSRRAS